MIVVAIIGILAAIAVPAYLDYTIRAQVIDGVNLGAAAKPPIIQTFLNTGAVPGSRTAAGMTALPTDTTSRYVASVDVQDGVIVVTYGNDASSRIENLTVTMTPYESPGGIVWRCGSADAPAGLAPLGTAAGAAAATYIPPTVPDNYLPISCRQ